MITLFLADGFEELEAITVIDLLRRAELNVVTVSIMGRKKVVSARHVKIEADEIFEDIDYDDCEMIVLPGGGGGARNLENHEGLIAKLNEFNNKEKWIAAICAAPMILGHNGILVGREATIYKGMEDELTEALFVDEKVVVDEHIITSQGPATAIDFALKIIELLKGKEAALEIAAALLCD